MNRKKSGGRFTPPKELPKLPPNHNERVRQGIEMGVPRVTVEALSRWIDHPDQDLARKKIAEGIRKGYRS